MFYFVRSGNVYIGAGFMQNAGIAGYNWSLHAYDNTAHYLGLSNEVVFSSGYLNRRYGFSLRCLAS